MYPTIEDIRKIAAKGQYKRVPVCREVYADIHSGRGYENLKKSKQTLLSA